MRNEPFLELVLCGLSPGEYAVELLSPVRLKQTFATSSPFKSLFFLHPEFVDPQLPQVAVSVRTGRGTLGEFVLPISVFKITGQVQDFDGNPFPAYLWGVGPSSPGGLPETTVRTDFDGRFTLWYPEGKRVRIWIDGESHARSTAECWITAEELKTDVRIDPRVGDFELYGLHAWHTPTTRQVYFWPSSLSLLLRSKKANWKLPYLPRLAKEDIAVRINGQVSLVNGLHIFRAWIGKGMDYPAHILELPLEKRDLCGPELVQVEVRTATRGRGEAWYIAHYRWGRVHRAPHRGCVHRGGARGTRARRYVLWAPRKREPTCEVHEG